MMDDELLAEIDQDLQQSTRARVVYLEGPSDPGKWIVEVFAPTRTGRPSERCRAEWIGEVAARGGSPEVRAFWEHVIHHSS
jgi:hypothetical protein